MTAAIKSISEIRLFCFCFSFHLLSFSGFNTDAELRHLFLALFTLALSLVIPSTASPIRGLCLSFCDFRRLAAAVTVWLLLLVMLLLALRLQKQSYLLVGVVETEMCMLVIIFFAFD